MQIPGLQNIKLRPPGRRELILSLLVLLGLLVVLAQYIILKPQAEEIKELKAAAERKEEELNFRLEENWDDIPALKREIEELRAGINSIHETVPDIKNEPALLVDLHHMIKNNRLAAQSVEFSGLKEVEDKNYRIFTVSTIVTGANENIYSFLKDLEEYPRLNRVEEIEIEPQNYYTSKCILAVKFYVLKEVQPAPLDYPFMEDRYLQRWPYNIFNVEGAVDKTPVQAPGAGGGQEQPPARK